MPELFPILRALIDQDRKANGKFILLGSASFLLHENINESLSGRVAFIDFSPFNLLEVKNHFSPEALWLKGGFPDALMQYSENELNYDWFEFYTRTLIERDLPALGIDVNNRQFRLLWKMITHFHGEILNKSKIASAIGISSHTVDRYINILEQTFTLRILPPFFSNIKKRLIKNPKVYFRDSRMFHYFSQIRSYEDLTSSPSLGKSFEGFVVEQVIQLSQPDWYPYFFRTSDGIESDLLLTKGKKIVPIEIKARPTSNAKDIKSLEKTLSLLQQPKGFVVSLAGDNYPLSERVECIGINKWLADGCPRFWET